MEIIYLNLLTECIVFARTIFSSYVSRFKDEQASSSEVNTHSQVLSESRFKEIISESNRHLDKLLNEYTQVIITEIHRLRVQDSVQDLQARISALRTLLNYQEIEPTLATQLVITALNPLHVSIEVVKLKLEVLGEQVGFEVWTLCRVIGISTLIAGYKFLGQDMPSLQKELEEEIKVVQKNILDEIATIASKGDIPWENIHYLISLKGIEDLVKLYTVLKEKYSREMTGISDPKESNIPSQANVELSTELIDIHSAKYGYGKLPIVGFRQGYGQDVTSILKSKVSGKSSFVCPVTNEELGGDPAIGGSQKQLKVTYSWQGKQYSKVVAEGNMLRLP